MIVDEGGPLKPSTLDVLQDDDIEVPIKSSSRSKKRKMGVFSAYYNFYFEMCKRLKQRMKENRKNFKFRKIYQRSKSAGPKSGKTTVTKKIVIKKKPTRSVSKTGVTKRVRKKVEGAVDAKITDLDEIKQSTPSKDQVKDGETKQDLLLVPSPTKESAIPDS